MPGWWSRRRLDAVEVSLVAVLVAGLTFTLSVRRITRLSFGAANEDN
jgi:hypothetical protein